MATLYNESDIKDIIMKCPDENVTYDKPLKMYDSNGKRLYAYVTLIMLGDSYIPAALVLAKSIRDSGSEADLVVLTERYGAIHDCLGICWIASQRMAPQIIDRYNMGTYAKLIATVTGWDISEKELIKIAERILSIERSINILAGLERKDDFPPDRFYEPIPDGISKGMSLDKKIINEMLKRHSELHGWDPETGVPNQKTLENLGLQDVADNLETVRK